MKKWLLIAAVLFVLFAFDRASAQYYLYGYSSIDYDPGADMVTVNSFSFVDYYVSYYYINGLSFNLTDPNGNFLHSENINGSWNPIEVSNYSVPGNGCGNYEMDTYHWVFLNYTVENYWLNGQYVSGFYDPTPTWTAFSETWGPIFPYYYEREFSLQGNGPEYVSGDTFKMLDNYQTFSDTSCFSEEIERVEFEVIGGPVDDHPAINGLDSSNRGKRIYPDKETVSDSTDRTKVRVKATVSPANAGVKLYFRTFDPDDPSTEASPLDVNGGFAGDDNKGNVGGSKAGQLSNCSQVSGWEGAACHKTTDSNGVAFVDLKVTKNPGDNFAVAVSKNWNAYLRRVTASGITLKNGAQTVPVFNPSNPPPPTSPLNPAMRTELLTVWRRLHIEVDSMGTISGNNVQGTFISNQTIAASGNTELFLNVSTPLDANRFENGRLQIGTHSFDVINHTVNSSGVTVDTANGGSSVTVANSSGSPFQVSTGQSFILYDDDDQDSAGTALNGDSGENVPPPDLGLLQASDTPCPDSHTANNCNILAYAYVSPVYDLGGGEIPFQVDLTDSAFDAILSNPAYFNNHASANNVDFWTIYLLGAYQPDTDGDFDPDEAGGGFGTIDTLSKGGVIFSELNRPEEFAILNNFMSPAWYLRPVEYRFTVVHEVGHLFGGDHDLDRVLGNAGLMTPSETRTQPLFNVVTLNKIRGGTGVLNP